MKRLTIVLPDLAICAQLPFDPCEGLSLPAICALMGRASTALVEGFETNGWLMGRFGANEVGAAELTRRIDLPASGDGYWLRADPVHLRPDRDRVMLYDASALDLTLDEAQALIASLNRQFVDDGMTFYLGHQSRWYLHLRDTPAMCTTPISKVIGQDIHPNLPAGADALYWHRVLNEIQMLLYTDPVNDRRELQGKAAANSIWLWGEGAAPGVLHRPYALVQSNDMICTSLASLSGATSKPLADGFSVLPDGDSLLWLDGLTTPRLKGDVDAWRTVLSEMEANWFVPILGAWQAGQLDEVEIFSPMEATCRRAILRRQDRWKFWRRPMALSNLSR